MAICLIVLLTNLIILCLTKGRQSDRYLYMEVAFDDASLEALETDVRARPRFPTGVIKGRSHLDAGCQCASKANHRRIYV